MSQFFAPVAVKNQMMMLPVHVTGDNKKQFWLVCFEEIYFILSRQFPDLLTSTFVQECIQKVLAYAESTQMKTLQRTAKVGIVVVGEFHNSDKNEM